MNYIVRLITLFSFAAISGCATVDTRIENSNGSLEVYLTPYLNSEFKQVNATFTTNKSKELVFRVLASLELTTQWLEEIEKIETLTIYNHSQFLLRTLINSPWPFKPRELVSCVNTSFEPNVTTIEVTSCSERWPLTDKYVRVSDVTSRWVITATSESASKVSYQTWLDPKGLVPVFFFNQQLKKSTEQSLTKLQKIIVSATLEQFAY
ncbi:MAG: hypothetical protein HRU23_05555 [Gammaproteobacteria bacterium]|nr:hypothetical protein [Gammaproteobacteria bacterium]